MAAIGEGPGAFGLVHADLHLDNALFTRDDVRPIDFDDCGLGHRVYELAVPLWEVRDRDDYPAFRAALLDGYAQHRDLPAEHVAYVDDYIAARQVAFALWFVGTAQVNPAFAAEARRGARALRQDDPAAARPLKPPSPPSPPCRNVRRYGVVAQIYNNVSCLGGTGVTGIGA